MITAAEVKQISVKLRVATNVIEHDYVLGCFLRFLAHEESVKHKWIFKGGTALAKCYFKEYRFSEDLDFTITKNVNEGELVETLDSAKKRMEYETGISVSNQPTVAETIEDDYGKESIEAKIYYNGPMQPRGSPRSIRVHLNREEYTAFPFKKRGVRHPYSDADVLPEEDIGTYALEEMFAEKLRAISGQRRFAISRDLYDIYYLSLAGLNDQAALQALKQKCEAKGIDVNQSLLDKLDSRRGEYTVDWDQNLEYLVPEGKRVTFETAWNISRSDLKRGIEISGLTSQ